LIHHKPTVRCNELQTKSSKWYGGNATEIKSNAVHIHDSQQIKETIENIT